MRWTILACLWVGAFLACSTPAWADETLRLGLFIGQNDGGAGVSRLRYAEMDAERIRDVMVRLGSVSNEYSVLLLNTRREEVFKTLAQIRSTIAKGPASPRVAFYFYYSGHSDENALLLGKTRLDLGELRREIKSIGADLRIIILDACQSGAAILTKGGSRAPSFLVQVDDTDSLHGDIVLTSSTDTEAAQESDRLGGGYFTHHLLGGLLGAADNSKDGQVTLEEAYAFAYHRTLFETMGSAVGLQHPSLQTDLQGYGSYVLTRPDASQTVLIFGADLVGQYLVFDRNRRQFVAELTLDGKLERRLALPSGRYVVQKRAADHLLVADLVLTRGSAKSVQDAQMSRSSFDQDFSKGVEASNRRLANDGVQSLSLGTGRQSFMAQPDEYELFPSLPLIGMEYHHALNSAGRWNWTASFQLGSQTSATDFATYVLASHYLQLSAGFGFMRQWNYHKWLLGAGPKLQAYYLRRTFPESEEPFQDFVNIVPGLSGSVGYQLQRKIRLDLVGNAYYLYYYVDGIDRSIGFNHVLFNVTFCL